ncbi:hypothetical protein RHMOL_Rhmol01G0091000 [Rhododendron molle]|uniref:Uncharacterized protein n=1 Tax=Rhododendron molle TaxID=49168 RepID=A0ACC0PZG4_RHOML|nr:hypothetical protein RHMOL_Rhmol01G0091000 [Rhododendron molle]
MIIRSFARAFTPPFLLLLLLLLGVTCQENKNQQFINSCGDIHNITLPFQLQGDPSSHTAYNEYFTLSCDENNRTVLNLLSGKYYVQSINYTSFTIRLADVGIQTSDICSSFPLSSLSDFFNGAVPYSIFPIMMSISSSTVVFLSCENPIQSAVYVNRTGYCVTRDESGNGYYSYVMVGEPEVALWDFPDSCRLDKVVCGSSPQLIAARGWNVSWLDLNRELAYGFEASWTASACNHRYSYSDIKKMTNDFRDKLGEGGYGFVYKGKLRSGPFVAIKMLSKPKANGQEFINEVATIGRIHHVNVVQLIGYCAERSKRALVYDFMPNGSLEKYILPSKGELSLSCKQIYEISLGVARGVGYLHQGCDMQILHFDIKPHNILLDENFTPKVSDFGLAKLYPTDDSIVTVTAARGTLGYMAPELFYKNIGGVSYKADIYSFGMLLMEMAGKRRNWNSSVDSSQIFFPSWVYDQFAEGKNIQIAETTEEESEMVKKMMLVGLWCIQMRPSDRPNSMNKVVEMLEGNIQLLHMPPKPFLYSQLAMQPKNGIDISLSNLSGACMDSLTCDISGR